MQQPKTAHTLAYEGDMSAVTALLDATPSLIHAKDGDERTLLHWAASGKHDALVQQLLERGAVVDAQDDVSQKPFSLAYVFTILTIRRRPSGLR
jgi:ankyrin repeat protein